mmetsp:Transcript_24158/g.66948  ORF Transcript_24158/g.66948 Transcript_24158/m.66948 type:complete len:536 (+) Transcript_24158:120-1727(+)|eukprot:CAMPEP_0168728346 /NCGR_PEP_ID=MMETSP0724-20121128/5637_1 /TAXON_ID=265536 /ORGANISM="Amphiprora sp., Strain CCMP467" /LENGTH=535 /DNA_ID=CAMNT_0008775189 /DNA_START=49 /DNA_END=1656 /DNA_ORIENTATION=-
MASGEGEGGPTPIATLNASTNVSLLSEEDLFACRLDPPTTKTGNVSYPTHKSGSIPYNPDQIEIVSLSTFLSQHATFQGRTDKVPNTLPPVDWKNQIFSENDNRSDLKDKVYLPLSRVLAPRNIAFGQDSRFIHREGNEDSVVVDSRGRVRVVVEEKSESLMKTLLPSRNDSFAEFCVDGRRDFLRGYTTQTSSAYCACPLILAQLLGYMTSNHVCRGILATAGRVVFVWIKPVDDTSRARQAKRRRAESKKIYVTEELFVDHPNFLRIMASFLVESFLINRDQGDAASRFLKVPSEDGGFSRGSTQKHTPKASRQDEDGDEDKKQPAKPAGSTKKRKKKSKSAVEATIPRVIKLPDFKVESALATTLGRERKGRVIGTKWTGIPVAVKIVNTDGEDREYARNLFHTEVEAYEIAGAHGLWGESVPRPLFVVETDTLCALGMVQGMSMPLDPCMWTAQDLQQGKEAVLRLHESGITVTDIKPANFVKLVGSGTSGNMEVTGNRVVAIDLEGFWKEAEDIELPIWLLRQDTPMLTS